MASHSMGAILFGLVYIHLAVWQAALLFSSAFLCGLGLAYLLGYLWLGWRYWFSVPIRAVSRTWRARRTIHRAAS